MWFLKTCAVAKKKSEYFDDKCIIWIELFGGHSISEVFHTRVVGQMHGVVGRVQRLQGECMELHVACKDNPFLLRWSVEDCNKKQ